jgi:hypothetical protein
MVAGADRASDPTAGSAIDAATASRTIVERGRRLAAVPGMRDV